MQDVKKSWGNPPWNLFGDVSDLPQGRPKRKFARKPLLMVEDPKASTVREKETNQKTHSNRAANQFGKKVPHRSPKKKFNKPGIKYNRV